MIKKFTIFYSNSLVILSNGHIAHKGICTDEVNVSEQESEIWNENMQ